MGDVHSAELPIVAIGNLAGNFTLPYPTNFAAAVPRRLAVPDVLGNGWYSLAVGSSGTAHENTTATGACTVPFLHRSRAPPAWKFHLATGSRAAGLAVLPLMFVCRSCVMAVLASCLHLVGLQDSTVH